MLLIVDYLFGLLVKYQIKKGLPGDYKPIEYALKECNEDILILGNSIVINSLKPSIIEDSLGMTCYNAGASGQTLYYYHTIFPPSQTFSHPSLPVESMTFLSIKFAKQTAYSRLES